jgi:hypothetical protein
MLEHITSESESFPAANEDIASTATAKECRAMVDGAEQDVGATWDACSSLSSVVRIHK